jgi:hypothetical protein
VDEPLSMVALEVLAAAVEIIVLVGLEILHQLAHRKGILAAMEPIQHQVTVLAVVVVLLQLAQMEHQVPEETVVLAQHLQFQAHRLLMRVVAGAVVLEPLEPAVLVVEVLEPLLEPLLLELPILEAVVVVR